MSLQMHSNPPSSPVVKQHETLKRCFWDLVLTSSFEIEDTKAFPAALSSCRIGVSQIKQRQKDEREV